MILELTASLDDLERDASWFDPRLSWTVAFWYQIQTSTPTGATYRNAYTRGGNAYVFLGSDFDTNDLILEVSDGTSFYDSTAFALTLGTPVYVAATYNAGTFLLTFSVNGAVVGTMTHDLSGWDFGTFPGGTVETVLGGTWGDQAIERLLIAQRAYTLAEIQAQMASPVPLSPLGLLAFNVLVSPADVTDLSGHGQVFTSIGATLTATTGPPFTIPVGSLALSNFGDRPMTFLSPAGVDIGHPVSAPTTDPAGTGGMAVFASGGDAAYWDVLNIFDQQWTILSSNPVGSRGAAEDALGNVYGTGAGGTGTADVFRLDRTNTVTGHWLVPTAVSGADQFRDTIAVNDAGTIAYLSRIGADTVWAYDLAGGADLGIFTTEAGAVMGENSIKVLPSGDILVGWGVAGVSSAVKRYSAAGATLATYPFPSGFGRVPCVALPREKTSFFANYAVVAGYGMAFVHIQISDGAILHQFVPPYSSPFDGFEPDGPFCVTSVPSTPAGTARLSVPVLSYTPTSTVLTSPTRVGLNTQGGPRRGR